jgi:hypothetical protein
MSGAAARLYEEDFVRWTEAQAAALREAGAQATNLPLDWENLAEEIDSLGRAPRRELRSRLAVIIEHLIKLEASLAADPRRGSTGTVGRERSEIEILLDDNPSLSREVAGMVALGTPRVIRHMTQTLSRHSEATPDVIGKIATANYTEDQVLGDWFPGDAPQRAPSPTHP